jgi:alkylation response protein AidB-like acyl-CoA dehydrogenase
MVDSGDGAPPPRHYLHLVDSAPTPDDGDAKELKMTTVSIPTAQELVKPVADDIARMAAQAEAECRLPAELMSKLMGAGLFSIYTPRRFGGMELPLPEALRVVEEVSRCDGSTGWTVALGFSNDLMMSALPEESAARVLDGGSALISGSPAPGVRAVRVAGGYSLTGRWSFNSGAPNANWCIAAAPIFDRDAPRMGAFGPEMIIAVLAPQDAQIIDTWHVTGLRASGSQDLSVDNVFVPDTMTGAFSMPGGPRPTRECILTTIPFFSLLGLVQAPPVCLGIARHAIDEFRELALAKERPFSPKLSEQVQAQAGLARAEALLRSARSYWYENVEMIWGIARAGAQPSFADRTAARLASLTVAENSVAAVDLVYRLAGSTAIFQSSPLERCFRDVHTAAQHQQVQDGRWETAGRILFGLDPASPII